MCLMRASFVCHACQWERKRRGEGARARRRMK